MKKFLAISLTLSMLFAIASCGGEDATSSTATSSTAPVSTAPAPTPVPTPTSSQAPAEPERDNLALTGTPFDDGSDEYYQDGATPDSIIDGSTTVGWQYKTDNAGDENQVDADTPNAYTNDDGATYYVAMTFEDGIYVGLTWEEAVTANEFQFFWEFGSRPVASEEGYVIEVTTDGENWEELEDAEITYIEVETPNLPEADVVTFEAMEIKGVRAVVYRSSTKYSPKLWELEVYGPEAEAETESVEAAE